MTRPDPQTHAARELFDRASDRLDQGMAFRLRRARMEAQQPRATRAGRLLPAGAFAAAVLALGLAWWMPRGGTPVAPAPGEPIADAELEALVVEEDAELYAWLAEAPVAAPEARL